MTTEDQARKLAKLKGHKSKSLGEVGELIARRALIDLGYAFIHRINTPWIIKRGANGKILSAHAGNKVAGDWRAVHPASGRSILVEVKLRDSDTLAYSDLEKHQHRSLHEHHEAGGTSLIVWVHERVPYVLRYPVEGFKPRSSIKIADAVAWDILKECYK